MLCALLSCVNCAGPVAFCGKEGNTELWSPRFCSLLKEGQNDTKKVLGGYPVDSPYCHTTIRVLPPVDCIAFTKAA